LLFENILIFFIKKNPSELVSKQVASLNKTCLQAQAHMHILSYNHHSLMIAYFVFTIVLLSARKEGKVEIIKEKKL